MTPDFGDIVANGNVQNKNILLPGRLVIQVPRRACPHFSILLNRLALVRVHVPVYHNATPTLWFWVLRGRLTPLNLSLSLLAYRTSFDNYGRTLSDASMLIFCRCFLSLPARRRLQGLVVIGVCLSVCLCVCVSVRTVFVRNISQERVHGSPPNLVGGTRLSTCRTNSILVLIGFRMRIQDHFSMSVNMAG